VILLGVLVLGAGFIGWEAFRPRKDPKFVGALPATIELVPRSRYQSKPWITIPWFGGKKFEYPPLSSMPKNWKDNPLASGFLQWKDTTPPAPKSAVPGDAFALMVSYMDWKSESGEEVVLTDFDRTGVPGRYYEAPYVFGEKPLRFSAVLPARNQLPPPMYIPSFQVEVPPLGRPAPRLSVVKRTFEGIELTLKPKEWRGPTFSTLYEVTATGLKPGELMLLSVSSWQNIQPNRMPTQIQLGRPAWFRVEPGKTSLVHILAPKVSIRGAVVKAKSIDVRVYSTPTGGAAGTAVEYKDGSGTVLARGNRVMYRGTPQTFTSFVPTWNGARAMQIEGKWIGQSYDLESWIYRLTQSPKVAQPHAPGDYKALAYYSVRQINFEIDGLRIPHAELEDYVRKAH